MHPARWQQIGAVFAASADLPAGERAAYLDAACAGDTDLRSEVERLLLADDSGTDTRFLEPLVAAAAPEAAREEALVGARLGPYRLTELIGQGGMGQVYRAERAEGFARTVAVKVIRRGVDSDEVLKRFRTEVQVQAALGSHPDIAALLDAGTTPDGRPYFVMEFVQGERIDRYCDRRRLGARDRLELFRSVCAAVQFAHRHAVIHRDLKPSNVLVTEEGAVKLIDFGIVKLTGAAADGDTTRTGRPPLTPEYASPEQVLGGPVTTASDVYSLGVVLYELLTGRRPLPPTDGNLPELARLHREHDTDRPSRAVAPTGAVRRGELTGDLDTIVLKALRKEPERRYGTVEEFSEDVRRHLAGLPVLARPDTFTYRWGKFARRNRVPVAAAALLALSLVGGAVGTTVGMLRARDAQKRAEANATEVARQRDRADASARDADQAVYDFFTAVSEDRLLNEPGFQPLRRDLLGRARRYYERFLAERGDDPALGRELATVTFRLARVVQQVGETDRALELARSARGRFADLHREQPDDARLMVELADCHMMIAALEARSDFDAASRSNAEAHRLLGEARRRDPGDDKAARLTAAVHLRLGRLREDAARDRAGLVAARDEYARGEAILDALAKQSADNLAVKNELAEVVYNLGIVERKLGDYPAALRRYDRALGILEPLGREHPRRVRLRDTLGDVYIALGFAHYKLNEQSQAVSAFDKARAVFKALADENPRVGEFWNGYARACHNLGNQLAGEEGKAEESLQYRLEACRVRERLLALNPTDIPLHHALGNAYNGVGLGYVSLGRYDEALAALAKAVEYQAKAVAALPEHVGFRASLVNHHCATAIAYREKGDPPAAVKSLAEAERTGPNPQQLFVVARERLLLATDPAATSADRDELVRQALDGFKKSLAGGYPVPKHLQTDRVLEPIREHPLFERAVAAVGPPPTKKPH
jgi:serine/threonine protein kinase/tetratricopeptide (TPR) repeat protein